MPSSTCNSLPFVAHLFLGVLKTGRVPPTILSSWCLWCKYLHVGLPVVCLVCKLLGGDVSDSRGASGACQRRFQQVRGLQRFPSSLPRRPAHHCIHAHSRPSPQNLGIPESSQCWVSCLAFPRPYISEYLPRIEIPRLGSQHRQSEAGCCIMEPESAQCTQLEQVQSFSNPACQWVAEKTVCAFMTPWVIPSSPRLLGAGLGLSHNAPSTSGGCQGRTGFPATIQLLGFLQLASPAWLCRPPNRA